jgi:hypothetical protein
MNIILFNLTTTNDQNVNKLFDFPQMTINKCLNYQNFSFEMNIRSFVVTFATDQIIEIFQL